MLVGMRLSTSWEPETSSSSINTHIMNQVNALSRVCPADFTASWVTNLAGKALIVQNKGGGHGELGYHLALKLIEKDISVTLLQDGGGSNKNQQPFAR